MARITKRITKRKIIIALQKSIEHWDEMIEWVRTQEVDQWVDESLMLTSIKQFWSGDHCALCTLFDPCDKCVLYKNGEWCDEEGSVWDNVRHSEIWGEWLKNASRMRDTLQKILNKMS